MFLRCISVLFVLTACATSIHATTYDVGPGHAHTSIGSVPWESLQAGDTVLIHHRALPYSEKFVLCRQGNTNAPITIRGIPGPNGELPVLQGNGATTRTNLNYWGETRAVIKIGGASKPTDTMPKFITVENLEVRSARPPYSFTAANGTTQNFVNNAAPIWIEKGENITIRNCTLHDSGNGFFVSSSDTLVSKNILVEGCYIHSNGNASSIYEHNIYTAAAGMTFQFNHLGPLRTGCPGNNLKDRSAGLVVRYNWIEGGNRQLDLVDAEDSAALRNAADYHATHVYGNVLFEPTADGNKQIVHYGGDSGTTANYRKGTLYFFNNTVVSKRPDTTTLFRLSSEDEHADVRNNILYVSNAGNTLALSDSGGKFTLSHNWLKSNWRNSFSTFTGSITNDGTNLQATTPPGFIDELNNDFRLTKNSSCVDAGGALHPNVLPEHSVVLQYLKHQGNKTRPVNGAIDLGAFEFSTKLQSWRENMFGTNAAISSIAGNGADPDNDGIINLLEYAFGQNPTQVSSNGVPRMQLISTNSVVSPALTFTKEPAPSGLIYLVQTSSNLVNWLDGCRYSDTTNLLERGETIDVAAPTATNRVIQLNLPPDNAEKRFLRVTVSEG